MTKLDCNCNVTSRLKKRCGKQQEVEVRNTDKGTKPGKGG